MVFKLWFDTENVAFEDAKEVEVVRILREIANKIEQSGSVPGFYQTIRDINGNDIGRYAEKSEWLRFDKWNVSLLLIGTLCK